MQIFFLHDGRLRAGWRLLLFVVLYLLSLILVRGLAPLVIGDPSGASRMTLIAAGSIASFLAAAAATLFMTGVVERQPMRSIGLQCGSGPEQGAGYEAGLGMAIAVTAVVSIAAVEHAAGLIRYEWTGARLIALLPGSAFGAVMILISSASEELLFRGYPFQRLIEGIRVEWSLGIASALFGILHGSNPHSTPLAVVNTMLAGILLSVCYLKTQRLWLAIGFHFAWNWSLVLVGLPVSGLDLGTMPWAAAPVSSRTWLYGGEYGPEGGLIATLALLFAVVFVMMQRFSFPASRRSAGPDQQPGISPEASS